jgi:hypothetical protein
MISRIMFDKVREPGRNNGSSRYTELVFQFPAMVGDTRRTAVSTADTKNDRVAFVPHFGPQLWVIQKHIAPFALEYGFHRGHVPGKPAAHFLQELIPAAKTNIY